MVPNQLPVRQVDPSLSSFGPQSSCVSFTSPLHSQPQQFEQSGWNDSVYSQSGYSQHKTGYQTLLDTPFAFGHLPPTTHTDLQSILSRSTPGAVSDTVDAWDTFTSISPAMDSFASSTTAYLPGKSEDGQGPSYSRNFEGGDVGHERAD